MRSKSRRGIGKCVWRDIDLERSKIGRDVRTIAVNANDLYNSSSTSTSTERVKLTRVAARSRAKVGWSWSSNLSLLRVSAQVRHGAATAASGNKSLRLPEVDETKEEPAAAAHTAERERPRSKGHPTILEDHSNWNSAF
jgi:hypothetical protein